TLKVRSGSWGLATPLEAMHALRDLTVGVVGFGRIGRGVAARLTAFKARVLVFDPAVKPEDITGSGCPPSTLPDLLSSSDVVTLHCPSNDKTRQMINRESLATMKPGSV